MGLMAALPSKATDGLLQDIAEAAGWFWQCHLLLLWPGTVWPAGWIADCGNQSALCAVAAGACSI